MDTTRSRLHPRIVVPAVLALALGSIGCSDDTPAPGGASDASVPNAQAGPVDPINLEYADELGIDFDQMQGHPSGLYLHDEAAGEGSEALSGSTVVVHYTGYLPDGTSFDSSRDRDQPFTAALGVGQVIPGWDLGLQGMRVGGRRTLVVPPDLAYGAQGAGGVIPPNAVLVFDVQLLAVE
ncbi:MAG: FKBP-type peptidyl-prolyl cis-trans isomerase [Gemmatimonadota bacterium]